MIKIGSKVPALKGATGDGEALALADFRGHPVVIYFYPKDNTSGCTREAQDFRDLEARFRRRKTRIIGVSRDSVTSHQRFADKYQLKFPLIADIDESWCRAFDVIHEKTLYGKRYQGIVRSTFLIDANGKLRTEWRGIKVPGHAQTVLDAVSA